MKKTIFMSRENGEKWLAALRSGEYEQGKGCLYSSGKYCCLGVLEQVVSGKVEDRRPIPSYTWLEANKISFKDLLGERSQNPEVREGTAAGHNDTGTLFPALADLIEEAMEYTDENV